MSRCFWNSGIIRKKSASLGWSFFGIEVSFGLNVLAPHAAAARRCTLNKKEGYCSYVNEHWTFRIEGQFFFFSWWFFFYLSSTLAISIDDKASWKEQPFVFQKAKGLSNRLTEVQSKKIILLKVSLIFLSGFFAKSTCTALVVEKL